MKASSQMHLAPLMALAVLLAPASCRKKEPAGSTGSPASASEVGAPGSTAAAVAPASGQAQRGPGPEGSASDGPAPMGEDPPAAQKMRQRLVRQIAAFDEPWGGDEAWDEDVLAAMRRTPRHLFMPGASLASAYQDTAYPIGHDQTISQPTIVALMTQALKVGGEEKVLEIGTGSGYQAAVLSGLVDHLYTIELVAPLGKVAKARLARLGYGNVTVRIGDGYRGWPEKAPFDRIILTAAPSEMPDALVRQLREGGIIVAPVGETDQWLYRWTKRGGELVEERLGAVRFVPMVEGGD